MRMMKRSRVLVAMVATMWLAAGAARASSDGLVFRALGFYKGKANASDTTIECEVPAQGSAIIDGTFQLSLWNTHGFPTLSFPDDSNPFADPCGVYLQLQNNLLVEGINVNQIEVKMRIPGAKRFAGSVPTRNNWPLACRQLRRFTIFAGTRLDAVVSETEPSSSGLPNVGFAQLLPLVSPQVMECLHAQYGGLPTDVYASLPIVMAVRATGAADSGKNFTSNTVRYTLTLRHVCGNGRVDDGEDCDPNAANTCLLGSCSTSDHVCGTSKLPCTTDADCIGTCQAAGNASECTCVY
jgi:hypothetical protein